MLPAPEADEIAALQGVDDVAGGQEGGRREKRTMIAGAARAAVGWSYSPTRWPGAVHRPRVGWRADSQRPLGHPARDSPRRVDPSTWRPARPQRRRPGVFRPGVPLFGPWRRRSAGALLAVAGTESWLRPHPGPPRGEGPQPARRPRGLRPAATLPRAPLEFVWRRGDWIRFELRDERPAESRRCRTGRGSNSSLSTRANAIRGPGIGGEWQIRRLVEFAHKAVRNSSSTSAAG